MSLYQCEKCGAVENTALGKYWFKGPKLCSECGFGKWHGKFKKTIVPKGLFFTNKDGNLEHKENGDIDFKQYAI